MNVFSWARYHCIWPHHVGAPGLIFALKLADVYRKSTHTLPFSLTQTLSLSRSVTHSRCHSRSLTRSLSPSADGEGAEEAGAAARGPRLLQPRPRPRPQKRSTPTPYTLHPTPYTLHPTPYTPHHIPCLSLPTCLPLSLCRLSLFPLTSRPPSWCSPHSTTPSTSTPRAVFFITLEPRVE